ncbi:MAG: phosphate transport system permease protein [Saprospiraceae bacterium]|jgi:phosphate transport system permease protein
MNNTEQVKKSLKRRYAKERRFKAFGLLAIISSFLFLFTLLSDITIKALPAFSQTWINVDIDFNEDQLGIDAADKDSYQQGNFRKAVRSGFYELFPDVSKRKQKKMLSALISSGAQYQVAKQLMAQPEWLNTTQSVWIQADDQVDTWLKSNGEEGKLNGQQGRWITALQQQNRIKKRFNTTLFTNGDSREPEQAGLLGALMGSIFTLAVTLVLSMTIGVSTAIYLEAFAPQNRITDIIEVNINNLAAVPSIIFGLLGLAIFISFFGVPRSTPLVGGLVLSLMTLPTIIVSSRAALKAVPPSIVEAALGVGASKMQATFQHALPLAMPGILTGGIIGMAQALGETAPLLMIGMIAFIVDVPEGIMDSATVLPVQIYLWADSPERAFTAMTAAGILLLLLFLVTMNSIAIILRKRFEQRW